MPFSEYRTRFVAWTTRDIFILWSNCKGRKKTKRTCLFFMNQNLVSGVEVLSGLYAHFWQIWRCNIVLNLCEIATFLSAFPQAEELGSYDIIMTLLLLLLCVRIDLCLFRWCWNRFYKQNQRENIHKTIDITDVLYCKECVCACVCVSMLIKFIMRACECLIHILCQEDKNMQSFWGSRTKPVTRGADEVKSMGTRKSINTFF